MERTLDEIRRAGEEAPTLDEVRRLRALESMGEAVTAFCAATGLGDGAKKYLISELEKINPEDFDLASVSLQGVADLFSDDVPPGDRYTGDISITETEHVFLEGPDLTQDRANLVEDKPNTNENTVGTLAIKIQRVRNFLDAVYGVGKIPEDADVESVMRAISDTLKGIPVRKNGKSETILRQFLEGVEYAEIAKQDGTSSAAITQWFFVVRAKLTALNAREIETQHEETTPGSRIGAVALKATTASSAESVASAPIDDIRAEELQAPAVDEISDQPIPAGEKHAAAVVPSMRSIEKIHEKDEAYVIVSAKIASLIQLEDGLHEALRQHLRPDGSVDTSTNKEEVMKRFRKVILEQFPLLSLPDEYHFDERDQRMLAPVVGVKMLSDGGLETIPPSTVAARIDALTRRGRGQKGDVEMNILSAFSKMLDALEQSLKHANHSSPTV